MKINRWLLDKWIQEGAEKQAWGLIVYMDLIERIPKPFYVMEDTEMDSKREFYSSGRYRLISVDHNISPVYSIVY